MREVRGLGLMWAIEFGEPETSGRLSWRMIERLQPGLFAQLVVVPLFREHRILSQVAGHGMAVIKGLPPLVVTDEDVDYFVDALTRDDQARTAHADVADALCADCGRYPLELAVELAELGARADARRPPTARRARRPARRASSGSAPAYSAEISITICRSDASTLIVELMALLGEDRERADYLVQSAREIVDLRLRGVPPGEHAEVHAHLECRPFVVATRNAIACSISSPVVPIETSTPQHQSGCAPGGKHANCARLRPDPVAAQIHRIHDLDEVLERQHVADRAQKRRVVMRRAERAGEKRHRQQDEVDDRRRALGRPDERRRRDAERRERAAPITSARTSEPSASGNGVP